MEGKECKDQERLKMFTRNPYWYKEGALAWMGTLSGPVAVDEERFVAAARNSAKQKEKLNDKCDFSGHVARRSSER